jgi:para-aminobenzoate synthetase/4-amino-4-deoxychorismate lyase
MAQWGVPDFRRPDPAIGLFETLLVLDGVPVELEAHLERLGSGVHDLYGAKLPCDTHELASTHAASLAVGRMRLTAVARSEGAIALDVVATAIGSEEPFGGWEHAIALAPTVMPGGLGAYKWNDRTGLDQLQASMPEGRLALLVDANGDVLEASRANVFAVEGETLITPPADGRILPGVTRARVIEAASSLGITVHEQAFTVARLIAAGEAFVTGSVRGPQWVRSIDDSQLRPPGELARETAAELRRMWTAPMRSETQDA